MQPTLRSVTVAGLVLALATVTAGPSSAVDAELARNAVFVMTDDTSANAVVAYERGRDGTLTEVDSYLTGGRGGVLEGAVVDNTASQGALTIDRTNGLVYAVNPGSNTIEVFKVDVHGGPSREAVVNVYDGTVPFAVACDPRGRAVVAEAGTNAVAVYKVRRDRTLSLVSRTPTGQEATCWITASGRQLYASNTESSTVSSFRTSRPGDLAPLGDTATREGTIDSAATADGDYLYVQTGAEGRVEQFRVESDGTLTHIGSDRVPDAVGGEGIVAT